MRLARAIYTALIIAVLFMAPAAYADGDRDILYQVSTIGALMEGGYDGQETISELMEHGGFGLGTFDRLDGEMVVLDGVCYQVKDNGTAYSAGGGLSTPFAAVTFYDADLSGKLEGPADLDALKKFIDGMLPDDGLIYAIKVDGMFEYVKTRSVSAQEKPYPKLTEAVKGQSVFSYRDVSGTIVGFRLPGYMGCGINVPGYHLHFIDGDKKAGGHLLECTIKSVVIGADATSRFFMALPEGGLNVPGRYPDSGDNGLGMVEGR